jgi:hypothetical protein
MKIENPTVLLKRNHYIKCFCFNQNVANKNTNIPDSGLFFSRCGCDKGVEEIDSNFKSGRRHVDDWNYEIVVENVKDTWKRQGRLLKAKE